MSHVGPTAMRPDPRYHELARQAAVALQAGDDAAAERAARALVQVNPREHAAWHALAVVALRGGQVHVAAELAERAHRLDRKNAGYLNTLGIAYGDLGQSEEALKAFGRALKLRPAFAEGHYNLAKVLDRQERLPEARDAYRRALAIDPALEGGRHNLARCLRRLGETAAALDLARAAHDERPGDVDRMISLANALTDSQGFPAGVEFVEECLGRLPDDARLHEWLGAARLTLGDWGVGWREYLWRAEAIRGSGASPAALPENLAGGVVLLTPDQGLGDTLFFLRFARLIRARAGRAFLRAPAKLVRLLAGHPDLDHVAADDDALPAGIEPYATVLLGDLPHRAGVRGVAPPLVLRADEVLVREWRQTLARLGTPPYVGLTWRAGSDLRTASEFGVRRHLLRKEIDLDLLARAVAGVRGTLVSVQRVSAEGETGRLAAIAGRPVHDLSAANGDLGRMTALLAVLDDYVGVSNTNMHLRAGLGLAAKVLVPYPPEFRWMAAGERSPWFPGFGVYRQRPDRRWDDALARLRSDLDLE